jgi:hypothetical protein
MIGSTTGIQPWGVIKGRIVDANGKAQAGVLVMDDPYRGRWTLPPQSNIDRATSFIYVATDQQGRFVICGLAPGVSYDIVAGRQPGEDLEAWVGRIAAGVTVKSGQTKDLGNLTPQLIEAPADKQPRAKPPGAALKRP